MSDSGKTNQLPQKINETHVRLRMGTIMIILSVSVAIVTSMITVAFGYGYFKRDMEVQETQDEKQNEKINQLHQDAIDYTTQEVGGLRGDMNTLFDLLKERVEKNEKDIDDHEDDHK